MSITLRVATSREDLHHIYHFRYSIYVDEMHRPQQYADHVRRCIVDPMDDTGHVLAAYDNDTIVGTVRTNFLRESDIGEYFTLYGLSPMPHLGLNECAITTRLMIAPAYRRGTLAARLACATYTLGITNHITTDYIDCNDHLRGFFARLGYLPHKENVSHPEYGAITVLKLHLTDIAHLDAVGSPFGPLYRKLRLEEAQKINSCIQK